MPADHDGHMRMVQDIVTDTPQEGAPEFTLSPGPGDDHIGPFLVSSQADLFPWVALELFDCAVDLQNYDRH